MNMIFKKFVSAALSFVLVLSVLGIPARAQEDEQPVSRINLDNIYEIAYSDSTNSKIADKNLEIFYDELDELNKQLDAAWLMSGSSDPVSRAFGQMTFKSLTPNQVSPEGKESMKLSVELSKWKVAIGGRSMLIAYFSTQYQYDLLRLESEKLSREKNRAVKMASLGLVTELEAKTLIQALVKLNNSLGTIGDSISKLKSQLANYINVNESSFEIEAFEGLSAKEAKEKVNAIDYKADLDKATENSLEIKIQKLKAEDGKLHEQQAESLNLKKLRDQFPLDFKELYKELSNAAANLENAEDAYAISKESLKFAELEYDFGIISNLEFENAKAQFQSEGKKLTNFKLAFSSLYYSYKAMLDGVWHQSAN